MRQHYKEAFKTAVLMILVYLYWSLLDFHYYSGGIAENSSFIVTGFLSKYFSLSVVVWFFTGVCFMNFIVSYNEYLEKRGKQ